MDAADFEKFCALRHQDVEKMIDAKISSCHAGMLREIDDLKGAFVTGPDGKPDFVGHHGDHAARMAAARSEKEFWEEAKKELVKGGVSWLMGAIKIVILLAIIGLGVKMGWVKTP